MQYTLVAVVVLAFAFAWSNGMHDAANAVATSLSTGALTPRIALAMSAVLNALGAMLGVGIAELVGSRLISPPVNDIGRSVVLAAFMAAIAWNMLTWWFGLPSSSTQALIGGLAGAGTVLGGQVDWRVLALTVALPTVLSCVGGFLGTWAVIWLLTWRWQDAAHERVLRWFRLAQSVSAATVSVGHGFQDGQKTMGAVMLAMSSGVAVNAGSVGQSESAVPLWLRLMVALALGLGTFAGGWRIIRTMARRIVRIDSVSGFAAEAVTTGLLYLAGGSGLSVSTTMTLTSGLVGGGAAQGVKTVRWGTIRQIVLVWVTTPLVTFALAGLLVLGQR